MPVFFLYTGKPSSADVASVVYTRQRHPRTARFQLNHIAGLERLCHSLILANLSQLRSPCDSGSHGRASAHGQMKSV
jgi:hypothetical protein